MKKTKPIKTRALALKKIDKIQKDELDEILKGTKDTAVVHQKLKELLKTVLVIGQVQFIKAGKVLSYIKENKTYTLEDSSRKITWSEFCSETDFPLPGPNAEAKRRKADMLIRVYTIFREKFKIDPFILAEIGYTKLHMICSEVESNPKKIDDWLEKGLQLTEGDLLNEIREGGKSFSEINSCEHKNLEEITYWKCKDCGTIFKKKP